MRQKKPSQFKKCEKCESLFPVLYKTVTDNGVRKKVCQRCATKIEQFKVKEKQAKAKARKKALRERITEKKLDSLVSKVIRSLYGDKCCTCNSVLEYSKLHCGHCLSRQFRATRYNPENLSSQCPACNLYRQGEQYAFGQYINSFHGEGTMEKLIKLSKSNIKIGLPERESLYKIYEDALEHNNLQKLIEDYYQIIQ
jgi:hypothetical protein